MGFASRQVSKRNLSDDVAWLSLSGLQIDSTTPIAEVPRGAAASPNILAPTSTVNIPDGPFLAMDPLVEEDEDGFGDAGPSRDGNCFPQDSPRMDIDKWDAERIEQLRKNLYCDRKRMPSIIDSDEAGLSMEEAHPRPSPKYVQADENGRRLMRSPSLDSIISATHSPQPQGGQSRLPDFHGRFTSQRHPGSSSPSIKEAPAHQGGLCGDHTGRRLMKSPSLDSIISTTHSLQLHDDQDRVIGSHVRFSSQRPRGSSFQRHGRFDASGLVSDDEENQDSASADARRDRLISEDEDDFYRALTRRARYQDSQGVPYQTRETLPTPVLERESIIDEETADLPLYRIGQRRTERDASLPASAGTSGFGHQRFQPNSGCYQHTFSIIDSSDEGDGRFDREERHVKEQTTRPFGMIVDSPREQRYDDWMAFTAPATTSSKSVIARISDREMMPALPSRKTTRLTAGESSESILDESESQRNSFETIISE